MRGPGLVGAVRLRPGIRGVNRLLINMVLGPAGSEGGRLEDSFTK